MKNEISYIGSWSATVDRCVEKAREELAKEEREPFGLEDVSVILSYYLELELKNQAKGFQPDRSIIRSLLRNQIPSDFPIPSRDIFSDEDYLQMVTELVWERLRAGDDAPSLRIDPVPLAMNQMKKGINFGLVFGTEAILFQETVQALQVDALRAELEDPRDDLKVNVLGIHRDWLSKDRKKAEKALIVDDTGLVKWVRFQQLVPLDVIQISELPRNQETSWHRELSRNFQNNGIELINPYENSSERADDKIQTHLLWHHYQRKQRETFQTPRFLLIPRWTPPQETVQKLKRFLEGLYYEREGKAIKIALQPNKGSEGYKVEGMEVDLSRVEQFTVHHPLVQYLMESVFPEDDALIREERGNLRYYKERVQGYRPLALRIHAAWDGRDFLAESGYAQLAKDESSFAASRSRGGEIVDLQEAFTHLYYLKNNKWVQYLPTPEDIFQIKRAVIQAADGLNAGSDSKDYLKFMGLDVVLEVEETEAGKKLIPVVLEANPRPAGLTHAKEFLPSDQTQARWHISTGLFRRLKLVPTFRTYE